MTEFENKKLSPQQRELTRRIAGAQYMSGALKREEYQVIRDALRPDFQAMLEAVSQLHVEESVEDEARKR